MNRVRILRSAYEFILDGFDFYEHQEIGVGDRFVESILSEIRSLRVVGGGHMIVLGEYRRKICSKFPYSIYYKTEHSEINVYRVLDNRRDSQWISDHLS